ncbi:MAG TPA: recombinase A [Kofleriaceae bacterium]|jgi:recombination protein RecA|nr:recombinase A [Kofleriaceae bacterium]
MADDLREWLANAKGLAATARVTRLEDAGLVAPATERWGLDALRGRLVELSARGATATLTTSIELVLEAQQAAEPVAWVTLGNATFYPPDLADSGVDLAALVVIRVIDTTAAARAAERLLRSGAFGLVILDFGAGGEVEVPIAHLGRLVTLAQTHDAAVVCITEKSSDTASLGSLVSLRAEALRLRDPDHGYDVTLRILKDKRRGPGWSRTIKLRGPAGF